MEFPLKIRITNESDVGFAHRRTSGALRGDPLNVLRLERVTKSLQFGPVPALGGDPENPTPSAFARFLVPICEFAKRFKGGNNKMGA